MPVLRFSACPESYDTNVWRLFSEVPGRRRSPLADGIFQQDTRALRDRSLVDGVVDLGGVGRGAQQAIFNHGNALDTHVAAQPDLGADFTPVITFVHGFQFDPRSTGTRPGTSPNPHVQLFRSKELNRRRGETDAERDEREKDTHATPWLLRATTDGTTTEFPGLAIAFGYESWGNELSRIKPARFDFAKALLDLEVVDGRLRNVYAQAYIDAAVAGDALAACLSATVRALNAANRTQIPIDIFCHSLGTRTVLHAIEVLANRYPEDPTLDRIGRVLMVAGAAHWLQAASALRAIKRAGSVCTPEFFNFNSTADDVLALFGARAAMIAAREVASADKSFLMSLWRFIRGSELIGREGRPMLPEVAYDRWVDITLDDGAVHVWGADHGLDLSGARSGFGNILDHWIHYTHRPNWVLYRRLLYGRSVWTTNFIREGLARRMAERGTFDWLGV